MADLRTQVDNNDFCTSCSGNGELLCCDGCVRSFHFLCLDPPMNPDYPPTGSWFCYVCRAKRDPIAKPGRGLFSGLQHLLHRLNPKAFSSPPAIREYFDGVRTGEEGEYEEAATAKHKYVSVTISCSSVSLIQWRTGLDRQALKLNSRLITSRSKTAKISLSYASSVANHHLATVRLSPVIIAA